MQTETFGWWTIVEADRKKPLCRCECGTVRRVLLNALRRSVSKSCGCQTKRLISEYRKKAVDPHAQIRSPEYNCWKTMRQRCLNPKRREYANYGARGVTVCEEWVSFQAFREHVGPRPPGHTLDRIDNSKGYEPGNVRWVDKRTQERNKRTSRFVDVFGERMTVADAADKLGLGYNATYERMVKRGLSAEAALQVGNRRPKGC